MTIFKKRGVAWAITAVMVLAAIGIGLAKTATRLPEHAPGQDGLGMITEYYIYDDANVLSSYTEDELAKRNAVLLDDYGVAIAVVTCNYGRDDLYNYAMDYAEDIGLGSYDFIVVLDISGDNYWLIQGYELVSYFTDDDCGDYAYTYMERDFARGDYDGAALSLTEALEDWYYNVCFSSPHTDGIRDNFRR